MRNKELLITIALLLGMVLSGCSDEVDYAENFQIKIVQYLDPEIGNNNFLNYDGQVRLGCRMELDGLPNNYYQRCDFNLLISVNEDMSDSTTYSLTNNYGSDNYTSWPKGLTYGKYYYQVQVEINYKVDEDFDNKFASHHAIYTFPTQVLEIGPKAVTYPLNY